MGYVNYNPNPARNLVGDCVVRALSYVLNMDWENMPSFDMSGAMGAMTNNRGENTSMNYSNGHSYDEQKKVMMRTLEDIMHKATSENDRMAIQNCIEKLRMD